LKKSETGKAEEELPEKPETKKKTTFNLPASAFANASGGGWWRKTKRGVKTEGCESGGAATARAAKNAALLNAENESRFNAAVSYDREGLAGPCNCAEEEVLCPAESREPQ